MNDPSFKAALEAKMAVPVNDNLDDGLFFIE